MKQFFIRQVPFLGPYLFLWLILGIIQLFVDQSKVILLINSHWSPAFDFFFKNGTHLGDDLFILAVVVLLLLYSYRNALLVVLTYAISGLIVQVCKRYIFYDIDRPWYTMAKVAPWLHKVEGARLYENSSFPSGHTTSAFALFAMLAFLVPNPWIKALLLLPAIAVAYSRMYLLQHFLIDVHIGSLLGVGTSVLLYYYLQAYWESHPRAWLRRGLLF